jgi:hypothetical protein
MFRHAEMPWVKFFPRPYLYKIPALMEQPPVRRGFLPCFSRVFAACRNVSQAVSGENWEAEGSTFQFCGGRFLGVSVIIRDPFSTFTTSSNSCLKKGLLRL